MSPDQEIVTVTYQIDDRLVKSSAAYLQKTVHDHSAPCDHGQLRGLAAEIHDEDALGILYIQIQPDCIRNGPLHDVYLFRLCG